MNIVEPIIDAKPNGLTMIKTSLKKTWSLLAGDSAQPLPNSPQLHHIKPNCMLIGTVHGSNRQVTLSQQALRKHVLVIGDSLPFRWHLIKQQMVLKGGLFNVGCPAIGPAKKLIESAVNTGRKPSEIKVINFFNVDEPTDTWNPFNCSGSAIDVAARIINSIFQIEDEVSSNTSSPFISNVYSKYYYQLNIALVILAAVIDFFNVSNTKCNTRLILGVLSSDKDLKKILDNCNDQKLKASLSMFLRPGGGGELDMTKVRLSIGCVIGRLHLLNSGQFQKVTDSIFPSVKFKDVIEHSLIAHAEVMGYSKGEMISNLLISDFASAVLERRATYDEVNNNYFTLPAFVVFMSGEIVSERLIEQASASNVSLFNFVPSLQANSLIMKQNELFVLESNACTKIFIGPQDNESAERAELLSGFKIMAKSFSGLHPNEAIILMEDKSVKINIS